jgi:uroporphyrinogen-III synthase
MPKPEIRILSTGNLEEDLLESAAAGGVHIECIPFIQTVPVDNIDIHEEIENIFPLQTVVVFTSANAVEAVADRMEITPAWQVYCTSGASLQLAEKYFGKDSIAGKAEDAEGLADKIIADGIDEEIFFFCGNIRREVLPARLREEGIEVTEIIVYTTEIITKKVEGDFAAILFFSPSGVQGFFKKNKIAEKTVLFAIGKTTAEEIRKYSVNKIMISEFPSKEKLIEKVLEYFNP